MTPEVREALERLFAEAAVPNGDRFNLRDLEVLRRGFIWTYGLTGCSSHCREYVETHWKRLPMRVRGKPQFAIGANIDDAYDYDWPTTALMDERMANCRPHVPAKKRAHVDDDLYIPEYEVCSHGVALCVREWNPTAPIGNGQFGKYEFVPQPCTQQGCDVSRDLMLAGF